ncbi:MAG: hypothetical protein ACTS3R_12190 [Inquilinaceae bacterium]
MRRPHRTAHARIWIVLAVALPAILIGAMIVRQGGPLERPAVQVVPPSADAT